MNYIRHLNAFFTQIKSDDRLTAIHVSLYMALFQYWNFNRFQNPFPVYRDNIMQLSKIGSRNTYHKCIKSLHQFGYIIYHAAPSRYLPVKISIIRLDTKDHEAGLKQLNLFAETDTSPSRGGGAHVPDMITTRLTNDTQQVPNMGHHIKPNIFKNSVSNTPTNKMNNEEENIAPLKGARGVSPHVSNLRHIPSILEVESYFNDQSKSITEARKFYYYNQSKNWMLTDKIPVYDWKALANKWMLNDQNINPPALHVNFSNEIQYLYERFLEGEKINKLILPEYADHLELELTETIMQQAWQRRVNQLSGSNESTEQKLWNAYMNSDTANELLIKDQPNLIALAKRLAVSKHFQKLKSKNITTIQANS